MDNCYSADRFAEDHIHTDRTCNIQEPQHPQKFTQLSSRFPARHLVGNGTAQKTPSKASPATAR